MKINIILFCLITLFALTTVSVQNVNASHSDKQIVAKPTPDPLEPFNRTVFKFNEILDKFILRPVAVTYRKIVPPKGRRSIRNAFDNLSNPVSALNSAFQGDFDKTSGYSWRFIINSTIGIFGLFDVAGEAGLYIEDNEDMGQTFGHYNIGSGFYIVLPVLGPSTFRDTIGNIGDGFLDPFSYIESTTYHVVGNSANGIVQRERILDVTDGVYDSSFDPYATIRSLYIQNRVRLINE